MKKTLARLLALALAAAALSACNTVQGIGQDVQAGGRAIERAAH